MITSNNGKQFISIDLLDTMHSFDYYFLIFNFSSEDIGLNLCAVSQEILIPNLV